MDALHYALLAVVVLLAVYAFGSFKEVEGIKGPAKKCRSWCMNQTKSLQKEIGGCVPYCG